MNSQPPEPILTEFGLTGEPVTFDLVTRLVLTIREPYKSQVLQLQPGQALRLKREIVNPRDSQAIRVETIAGMPVGYIAADTASYLAILLDHAPDLTDESFVETLQTAAPPDDAAARRLRYPKLTLHLRLCLGNVWPLFTIAAVLGLKTEDFAIRFNLAGNPWLAPLQNLHEKYLQTGHDHFQLPASLTQAWIWLTSARRAV
jgi:hypothetical protein